MDKILPIWQPIGYSTHRISKEISNLYGVKTSHTGTIDPMAEGVIIILLDDERFKKYDYAKWLKEYEFTSVFGISTDTYDGMGIINKEEVSDANNLSEDNIKDVLKSFVGEYSQSVPKYSTIKVSGKNMFKHARSGLEIDLPIRKGIIHSIELTELGNISFSDLKEKMISRVESIFGDFRQKEIISRWRSVTTSTDLVEAKVRVLMTKGLYVRSLSQDIGKKLGVPCMISDLTRTKNGIYNQSNSKTIEELFGNEIDIKNLMPGSVSLED